LAARSLQRLPRFAAPAAQREADARIAASAEGKGGLGELLPLTLFFAGLLALVLAVYRWGEAASAWILPGLILGMLGVGVLRGVKVYEVFVQGAREGFDLAVTIIPYLVAILSAVGMFRASGGLKAVTELLGKATELVGLPAEVLPLALLRPLSGSGAFGITAELIETHGPDSYIGQLARTMNRSTETTFYVLAVYFGSVGITRIRHAVAAGLAADLTGVLASVLAVKLLLG
jgi:spore maturation protein SpmB